MSNLARQRESFPELDLIAASAAMNRIAAAVCVYSWRGGTVGQLFIVDVLDNSVVVNYTFATRHVQSSEQEAILLTKTVKTKFDHYRRFLQCPTCGEYFWKLYFDKEWACAKCLGLHYRRQLVDKLVVLWERRDALEAQLKYGRPKGMHNETYWSLKSELALLEAKLRGKERKFASDAHDLILSSRWVPAADVDLWSSKYTVRRGDFVRIDELEGY